MLGSVKGRVRTEIGGHEEKGLPGIPSSEKIQTPVCDPVGRVIFFFMDPGPRQIAVAVYAGVCYVSIGSQLLFQPVKVVVSHELGFPVWNRAVPGAVEISVVKVYIMESQKIAKGMDMHLSNTLSVISGSRQLPCHCMFVIPGKIVFIAYPAMMALFPSGMEGSPGGNTTGAGTVCMVEDHPLSGQTVKIRGLYIWVTTVAQAVSPELVCHD